MRREQANFKKDAEKESLAQNGTSEGNKENPRIRLQKRLEFTAEFPCTCCRETRKNVAVMVST